MEDNQESTPGTPGTPVTLTLEARRRDDQPLFFREAIGHVEAPDGVRYKLDLAVGRQGLVVTVVRPEREDRMYLIDSVEVIMAVIKVEDAEELAGALDK